VLDFNEAIFVLDDPGIFKPEHLRIDIRRAGGHKPLRREDFLADFKMAPAAPTQNAGRFGTQGVKEVSFGHCQVTLTVTAARSKLPAWGIATTISAGAHRTAITTT
jgi:hypothetical protein